MSKLFECDAKMPKDYADPYAMRASYPSEYKPPSLPKDMSIAVAMTPEQDRAYRTTSYPVQDAMSVVNVERPRFGKKV